MSESAKTIAFVTLALLAVAAAYFVDRPTQAVNVTSLVGTTLNSDFEVDTPKRLQIVKFDRPTAETKQFEVASQDGVWRIPSKQDYPADATQQMAAAANALIDRKILRVAAETAQSHEELGVVDPQSAKLDSNSQGVGTRVIMSDADDKTLVDMIIGKKVNLVPLAESTREARSRKAKEIREHYHLEGRIAFIHVELADNRSEFSSGVSGQIQPRSSISAPQAAAGRCRAAIQGQRSAGSPPTTTNATNSACTPTTRSARKRYAIG